MGYPMRTMRGHKYRGLPEKNKIFFFKADFHGCEPLDHRKAIFLQGNGRQSKKTALPSQRWSAGCKYHQLTFPNIHAEKVEKLARFVVLPPTPAHKSCA